MKFVKKVFKMWAFIGKLASSPFVRNIGTYISVAILGYEVNDIIDGGNQQITTIERYRPNEYTETVTQKTEISGMDILILCIIAFLVIISISFYIIRLLRKNADDTNQQQQEMELPQIGGMDV